MILCSLPPLNTPSLNIPKLLIMQSHPSTTPPFHNPTLPQPHPSTTPPFHNPTLPQPHPSTTPPFHSFPLPLFGLQTTPYPLYESYNHIIPPDLPLTEKHHFIHSALQNYFSKFRILLLLLCYVIIYVVLTNFILFNNIFSNNLTVLLCGSPTAVVERSGSGVELRTLDYENPGSNPVLRC